MTRLISWLNKESVSKWFGKIIATLSVTGTLALITYIITSFTTLASGSKNGNAAYEDNRVQDSRIEVIENCYDSQKVINIVIQQQVETIKEDIREIKSTNEKMDDKLDQILLMKWK